MYSTGGLRMGKSSSTDRRKALREALREEFALGTSCHGLSRVYSNKSKWIRSLWIVVVLAVFGILVWQIVDRFQAYFRFDTSTQGFEVYEGSLPLPAVTICNINRYFYVEEEERKALNVLSSLYDYGNATSRMRVEWAVEKGVGSNFTSYLLSKAWQLQQNETVVYCFANGRLCTKNDFTPFFSGILGQCWILNANTSQSKSGIANGFSILFNINQGGYSEDFDLGRSGAGILFHVHAPQQPPQAEVYGLSAGVGQWSTTATHKRKITNMYTPWGQCEPSKETLTYNPVYSVAACYVECINRLIVEKCKCRDPTIAQYQNYAECTAEEVLNCTAPSRFHFEDDLDPSDCGCNQACNDVKYATDISYSTFPSQRAVEDFVIQTGENVSVDYMRENLVGLSVFFDQLSITNIVESKAISESALLSDIGGQLGLWIGISVVTICEFIELFLKLSWTLRSDKPKTHTSVEEDDDVKERQNKVELNSALN